MKYLYYMILVSLSIIVVFAQDPGDCQVEPSAYEYSMNIIASVSIDDSLTNNANNLLGAFVDSECRGVINPLNFNGFDIYFLVIYSNTSNETISFTFYDADENINITLAEQVTFLPNLILGSVIDPFPLYGINQLMGDLNHDGDLDILDIIQLVAIILGQVSGTEYQYSVGDTNGDLALDVIDIVTIVGWIMS